MSDKIFFVKGTVNKAHYKLYGVIAASIWTVVVLGSMSFQSKAQHKAVISSAKESARSHFIKDVLYRKWNSVHGGVYAPITEQTPSNPYLDVEERDIETPSGKKLTLINPAYMTRQVHELGHGQHGIEGHITSLNPIRPANAPDDWEREALLQFEQGIEEVTTVTIKNGKEELRLIQPLVTVKGCLKCHAKQGYKVGDVRGGISVTIPLDAYLDVYKSESAQVTRIYFVIWLIGLATIGWGMRRLEDNYIEMRHIQNDLRQTGDELQQSQERLERVIRGSHDAPWDWDYKRDELYYSPRGWEQLGYKAGDMPSTMETIQNLIHSDDKEKVRAYIEDRLEKGPDNCEIEFRMQHKDGHSVHILSRFFITRDKDGRPSRVSGTHMDNTERLELESQLRQAQKLESLGTLAGGVAHEINNPINGIMNYAQLILDAHSDDDPQTSEFATEIISESKRVANIVHNLLSFSRQGIESDSIASVSDMIDSAISLIKNSLNHDQTELVLNVPNDLPNIKCKEQQILQVLMNLTTNARDSLNEKYPKKDENKKLIISAAASESNIRITIEDTGTGIPRQVQERIFEPFFTTKPRDRGTGLGLAITHGIIKDHGGKITLESEPGQGTKFHIDLPITR
ncbi:hypothetical protein BVX97_01835 [bacterium E08(2017)]|nr:hypothetical protein BVX97_01835 [bacterium E08(2017)]